mgnify:CR=1 FL=1
MEHLLRISGIADESIVDGKGLRYTIFAQGCPHHCKGCHNPATHRFTGGTQVDITDLFAEICKNPLLSGVTFSGGEPFCQPAPFAQLAQLVHSRGLNVTVYTGYTFEELFAMQNLAVQNLLAQTDILIDGKFELDRRDLTLVFRGSSNQRILDIPRSLAQGKAVLASGYEQ